MKKTKEFYTLSTPYEGEMDKNNPWNVYPRPQFVRDSFFSLNGHWDFAVTDGKSAPSYNKKILVPFPPESRLSEIEERYKPNSVLYYRRTFTLPDDFIKDRVILHFGAVDCLCEIMLNGSVVGKNEGGYLPFSFDITEFCNDCENEIILKVTDGTSNKYPYGKQKEKRGGMWYTPISGIWQTVWIESIPKGAIESLSIEQHELYVYIKVRSDAENVILLIKETGKQYRFRDGELTVRIPDARLWSPEDPFLYHITVMTAEDSVDSYFAFRSLETKKDKNGITRTYLNGKPYFISGLLDQGYYPDGIFLPATVSGYKDDILRAKAMGFNMLRKHIKIEPMVFYHLCDTLGMIVFQDMVNSGSYSFFFDTILPTIGGKFGFSSLRNSNKKTRRFFTKHMLKTASHLYNTPSVLQYTIFNEGWGQFRSDDAYNTLVKFDNTRLIDTTSGWFKGKLSDFDSRHIYFKKPKIKRPDGRAFFISEFGGFAFRVEGHLFGGGNYGYSTYKTSEELYDAIRKLYTEDVLPLIKKGLNALVYTQLTDVEDETNGLITYDRQVIKIESDLMWAINDCLREEFRNVTEE